MSAGLFVEPDALRAYGATSSAHTAELHSAAARLSALRPDAALLGPVGARFVAALQRAADGEAGTVTRLGDLVDAARRAAVGSATAYEHADAGAGARLAAGT